MERQEACQRPDSIGHPRRYRIPDLCVVALPYAAEPVLTRPPHLAIEIYPRTTSFADVLAMVGEYLQAGMPHIWMPNPYRRTLPGRLARPDHTNSDSPKPLNQKLRRVLAASR